MKTLGATGRRITGAHGLVVRAGLMLMLAGGICAAAAAAEPGPERAAVRLPALRVDAYASAVSRGAAPSGGFRPEHRAELRVDRRTIRFYDTHLIPRLSSSFGPLGAAYEAIPGAGTELGAFVLYDHLTDSARRNARSAATRALRDFAIDWTDVAQLISSAPRTRTDVKTRAGGTLGFSMGFSHRMPELGLRYRVGGTTARLEIDGRGEIELEFDRSAEHYTRVGLSAQPQHDLYQLSYRLRF